MTTNRYFFYDEETHQTYVIDGPEHHPAYVGERFTRRGDNHSVIAIGPAIQVDGRILLGRPMKATQRDDIACTTGCKRATHPDCSCSCGGKNHGSENVGIPAEDKRDALLFPVIAGDDDLSEVAA